MTSELTRQRKTTLVIFLGLLFLFLALNVAMIAPFLLSLFLGFILWMLTRGTYVRISARTRRRGLAASLTVVGVFLVIIVPVGLFVLLAVQQGIALADAIGSGRDFSFHEYLQKALEWGPVSMVTDYLGSPENVERQIRVGMQNVGKAATGVLLAAAANIPGIALQLVLALLTCYFLLLDGRRLMNWLVDKAPLETDVRQSLADTFKDTAISVIWATIAAAGTQGLMMSAAYLLLGVPGAFLAGGATFIFAWIPVLGSTPVWVIGAGYLFATGSVVRAILMIIAGLITSVADNFVRPIVLKGRSDMHPLISLVAIFGGIQMFGILGVFYGPILTAMLVSLLEAWPVVGRRYGLIQ